LRYCLSHRLAHDGRREVMANMQDAKNSVTDEPFSDASENELPLCQLVRSMVAMMESHTDVANALPVNGVAEHVLFDVDVDGDRYILLKMIQMDRSVSSLSPREREIVRMVARGHPNKVIAAVLNISSWTVCTHLRRVFAKLGVTSRAAMVAKVADLSGVIEPQERMRPPSASSCAYAMGGAKKHYPASRVARK
jgi:DNA-binding CsgD family transcriptional regulator